MVERQVDRLAGQEGVDESAKHKTTISKLEEALALAKVDTEALTGQLQVSLKASGKSIEKNLPTLDLRP